MLAGQLRPSFLETSKCGPRLTGNIGRLDSLAVLVRRATGRGRVAWELGEVLHRAALQRGRLPRRSCGVSLVPVFSGSCRTKTHEVNTTQPLLPIGDLEEGSEDGAHLHHRRQGQNR